MRTRFLVWQSIRYWCSIESPPWSGWVITTQSRIFARSTCMSVCLTWEHEQWIGCVWFALLNFVYRKQVIVQIQSILSNPSSNINKELNPICGIMVMGRYRTLGYCHNNRRNIVQNPRQVYSFAEKTVI